jgi:hypothetical protein
LWAKIGEGLYSFDSYAPNPIGVTSDTFDRSKLAGALATANREIIVEIEVLSVKSRRDVSRLLAALQFPVIGRKDLFLDLSPAVRIDRMGDVGVKLEASSAGVSVAVVQISVAIQAASAMITKLCPEVVLFGALWAVIGNFSGRHGEKEAVVSVDQFHIADDERIVKSE